MSPDRSGLIPCHDRFRQARVEPRSAIDDHARGNILSASQRGHTPDGNVTSMTTMSAISMARGLRCQAQTLQYSLL